MKLPEEFIVDRTLFLRNLDKPILVASYISALANNKEGGRIIIGVKSKFELAYIDIDETKSAIGFIINHYVNIQPTYLIEEINIENHLLLMLSIKSSAFICKVKEIDTQIAYLIYRNEVFEMNKILFQYISKIKANKTEPFVLSDLITDDVIKFIQHEGSLTLSQVYSYFNAIEKKTIDKVLVNLLLMDKIKYEYNTLQTKFKINC